MKLDGALRRGLSQSAQLLIAICLSLLVVSQLLWWAATSYFMVDREASISFMSNDGWCNAETHGVGIHCFGDYYFIAWKALSSNPWDLEIGANPNPALGMLPIRALQGSAELLNMPRLGLMIFLLIVLVSLSSAAIWAMQGLTLDRMAMVLLVAGPVTAPALIALDRGSAVGLTVFPLLWFAVSVLKSNRWQSVLALILVSSIKPQFALLIFVVISLGWFKESIVSAVSILSTQLLAFGLWPNVWPQSMVNSFNMISGYQNYTYAADPYPPQLSFAHGISTIEFGLRSLFGSLSIDSLSIDPTTLSAVRWQSSVGLVISLVVLLSIALARSRLPLDLRLILAMAVCSYASSGTVFAYYGVVSIVIAALIIRPIGLEEQSVGAVETQWHLIVKPKRTAGTIARGMIILATAISLTVLPLPIFVPYEFANSMDGIVFTTSYLSTIAWLGTVLVCLGLGIFGKFSSQRLFSQGANVNVT